MSLDKFGRASHSGDNNSNVTSRLMSLPIAFTSDGNVDCENRSLCNVNDPRADVDATNKKYVDQKIANDIQQTNDAVNLILAKRKKYLEDNIQKIRDDFQTAFNDYTKAMAAQWDRYMNQYEFKLNEMNREYNGWVQTTSNLQTDFNKAQTKIIQYFEELQQFKQTIETLDGKLTATDSLTKNIESELNQFRNTVVPQISELSLMIKNGDDNVKKQLRQDIDKLNQDINKLNSVQYRIEQQQ